jgi:hypothetical protein
MVSKDCSTKMFVLLVSGSVCGYAVALTSAWVLGHAGYVLLASFATVIATFLLLNPVLELHVHRFKSPATARRIAFATSLIVGAAVFLEKSYQ